MSASAHPHAERRSAGPRRFARRAFLSPWLIGFCVFFAYPLRVHRLLLLHAATTASARRRGPGPGRNWAYVFQDYPLFWPALRNTSWLVRGDGHLPGGASASGSGLLITKIKTGAGVFRTLFYLPYLAPPVAATLAFVFLLNPGTGPVNSILEGIGVPAPGWFDGRRLVQAGPDRARGVGRGRPDGRSSWPRCSTCRGSSTRRPSWTAASAWQRFRFVTLPNISPIVLFAVVTGGSRPCSTTRSRWSPGRSPRAIIGSAGHHASSPAIRTSRTLTLPQLVYNLGFQRFGDGLRPAWWRFVLFALSPWRSPRC